MSCREQGASSLQVLRSKHREFFNGQAGTSFIPTQLGTQNENQYIPHVQVFDMAASSGQEAAGSEVTGPEDPLRLTVWHSLDRPTHVLTLGFQAYNRLTVEIKGAGIR